jgi:hypothetical protein
LRKDATARHEQHRQTKSCTAERHRRIGINDATELREVTPRL